jgi:hypothetical protein
MWPEWGDESGFKSKVGEKGEQSMQRLIGKKIEKVFIGEAEESLYVTTDQGILKFTVSGDCCSESWFSDIYNFDALTGGVVRTVEDIELPGDSALDKV